MIYLLYVDRENKNASSFLASLKGTEYDKFDKIDIKLEYYKSNKSEVENNQRELTEDEITEVNNSPLDYKFKFNIGDKYIALGKETFPYISKMIHLGPRSEGFYDISKMDYLLTREGVIFKFAYTNYEKTLKWLTEDQYNKFYSNKDSLSKLVKDLNLVKGISKKNGRPYFKMEYSVIAGISDDVKKFIERDTFDDYKKYMVNYKYEIIRTPGKVNEAFDILDLLSKDIYFGLDYETSGFPFDDKNFYHMGVSIVSINGTAYYFDMDYLNRTGNLNIFLNRYEKFLDKNAENCVTYNQSFEMRATYLLFNKLYYFQEASSINKLDGLVYKNFSLKYTAMKNINVASWDDDFEYLGRVLSEMFEKYTINNYTESDIWKEICSLYPEEINEFKNLFNIAYGDEFRCIPANLLGKYCCLDSYYTVLLRKVATERYKDPRAWSCYNNNLTLGALLGIYGCNIDTKLSSRMRNESLELVAAGNLVSCYVYLNRMIKQYKGFNIDNLPKYISNCFSLGISPLDSKNILFNCQDKDDEFGLDRNKLKSLVNPDLYEEFVDTVEMYGSIIDGWRRRSVFTDLNNILNSKLSIESEFNYSNFKYDDNEVKVDLSIEDIIKYSKYLSDKKLIVKLLENYRDGTPFIIDGVEYDYENIANYCKNNIINIGSPIDDTQVMISFIDEFINMGNNILNNGTDWENITKDCSNYSNRSVNHTDNKYEIYMKEYYDLLDSTEKYLSHPLIKAIKDSNLRFRNMTSLSFFSYLYFEKYEPIRRIYELKSKQSSENIHKLNMKEWDNNSHNEKDKSELGILLNLRYNLWDNFEHLCTRFKEMYEFNQYYLDYIEYDRTQLLKELEVNYKDCFKYPNSFYQAYLFINLNKAAKKYFKISSTYIDGQFTFYNKGVNKSDKNLISTKRYLPINNCDEIKMYSPVNVSEKKSKRWSAPMHTVPSHSEVKRLLTTPKGYMLTYFDISGAEVRAISYISQDEYMLDCYSKKIDPYINLAQFLDPGKDKKYYKGIRYIYKILMLGALYGMGVATMSAQAGIPIEDATIKYEEMFKRMSGIKRLIQEKGKYCREHNGLVESFLGDRLEMDPTDGERLERLGINQFVQNAAAVTLAEAFCNNIRESRKIPNLNIVPVNVVHDSSQNYVSLDYIFDIYQFYYKNLSDYCWDKYHIRYEFDLEVGSNYYDMCELKSIDKDTIKLSGNWLSLNSLKQKIDTESNLKYEIIEAIDGDGNSILKDGKLTEEFKRSEYHNPFYQFVQEFGEIARYDKDDSDFSITIRRLS